MRGGANSCRPNRHTALATFRLRCGPAASRGQRGQDGRTGCGEGRSPLARRHRSFSVQLAHDSTGRGRHLGLECANLCFETGIPER